MTSANSALQIGGVTETVTITSEITPVQVADSARRSTLTLDDIANIPTKGRDIFGMLGTLPGVQDTNLNRDFTQWRSAISITINGMPSQNKDVRVDGINIVDEGGCGTAYVNLNMDAVGEVQVISNGYTAENGRNNGGVISMVTKSGTNQLRASGWYNGRRDRFNENDYFREGEQPGQAALPRQHLRLQRRRPGGDPGPDRQPAGPAARSSISSARRNTPTTRGRRRRRARTCRPALEYNGDFSQTLRDHRHGTVCSRSAIRSPASRSPATGFRRRAAARSAASRSAASTRSVSGCCGILPEANGILEPAGRPVVDVELGLRPDAGARPHQSRRAHRYGVHREDAHGDSASSRTATTTGAGTVSRRAPASSTRTRPGCSLSRRTMSQVLRPTVVNEIGFGYTHNRWGFKAADDFDYTLAVSVRAQRRSAQVRAVRADYSDPPQIRGIGGRRSTSGRTRRDSPPSGGDRAGPGVAFRTSDEPIPRLNLSGRFYFNDDMSITRGRHNFKMGVSLEYNRKTEPGSADYMGNFNFGHNANNPLSTGNGYANMLLGVFTTYTELTSRVDRDVRHWQNDFYFQDNWRMTPRLTLDLGLRVQHSGSDFEVNNMNSGFFADLWQREPGGPRVPAGLHDRRARQPGLRGRRTSAPSIPADPGVFFPAAFAGNIVPGSGSQTQRHHHRRHRRPKGRDLLHVPVLRLRAARGLRVERHRRREDGDPRIVGHLLQLPAIDGRRRLSVLRRLPGLVHAGRSAGPGSATSPPRRRREPDREPGQRHRRAATNSRSRSRTTSNLAFQRDIGFNTVAEIAWVGNYTWNHGRFVDVNRLPLYVFGNPNNLVNNAPINANSLR